MRSMSPFDSDYDEAGEEDDFDRIMQEAAVIRKADSDAATDAESVGEQDTNADSEQESEYDGSEDVVASFERLLQSERPQSRPRGRKVSRTLLGPSSTEVISDEDGGERDTMISNQDSSRITDFENLLQEKDEYVDKLQDKSRMLIRSHRELEHQLEAHRQQLLSAMADSDNDDDELEGSLMTSSQLLHSQQPQSTSSSPPATFAPSKSLPSTSRSRSPYAALLAQSRSPARHQAHQPHHPILAAAAATVRNAKSRSPGPSSTTATPFSHPITPKSWTHDDFNLPPPSPSAPHTPLLRDARTHPQHSTPLRPDATSIAAEQGIAALLALARLSFHLSSFERCTRNAARALGIVHRWFPDYPPLAARCCFYIALGNFGTGRLGPARGYLIRARACVRVYEEGELMPYWWDVIVNRRAAQAREREERSAVWGAVCAVVDENYGRMQDLAADVGVRLADGMRVTAGVEVEGVAEAVRQRLMGLVVRRHRRRRDDRWDDSGSETDVESTADSGFADGRSGASGHESDDSRSSGASEPSGRVTLDEILNWEPETREDEEVLRDMEREDRKRKEFV